MAEYAGREITQRELRNDSGEIMRAVERGESFTISRNGTPIGQRVKIAPELLGAGPGRREVQERS